MTHISNDLNIALELIENNTYKLNLEYYKNLIEFERIYNNQDISTVIDDLI